MSSTYTLNNGIELIGTGEQSGTWGATTNTNFELLDTALDGQVTITASSAGSSGSPNSLPVSDGAASNGRNRLVNITSGSDLGATVYYQLTPSDAEKIIYIRNSLNTQSLIVFQGTYNASNDYEIPNGKTAIIFFNGVGSGAVAANVMSNAHFDALNIVGNAVVGGTVTATGTSVFASLDISGDIDVDGTTNLDVVDIDGAVDMASTLTVGGDISLTGATTISNTSGDLTLDVAGDIVLDADGGDVALHDGGTAIGRLGLENGDLNLASMQQDYDVRIKGNDGGLIITALHLDMSEAGAATFNNAVMASGTLSAHQTNKGVLEYTSNFTKIRSYGASSGTGQIQFLTGGGGGSTDSLAMTIDTSGNVIIGAASAVGDLHVQRTDGAVLWLGRTTNSGQTTALLGEVRFGDTAFDSNLASIQSNLDGSTTSSNLSFYTQATGAAAAERMRISSAGDVELIQSNNLYWKHQGGGTIRAGITADSSDNLTFSTGSSDTTHMTLDGSGRVGIGAAPNSNWRDDIPNQKVLMLGTEATFFSDSGVTTALINNAYINNSDTFVNISTRGASHYFQYEGAHKWYTAASARGGSNINTEMTTPKMTLDNSGRLLIGTATDSNAHANADNLIIGNVPASGVNAGITIVSGNDANGAIHFSDGTSSGNANIQGQLVYEHANNAFVVYTAITERMRIDSLGRVGIKTAANASFDQVAGADLFVLGSGAGDQGMTIYSGNGGTGNIMFADGTTTSTQYEGYLQYVHSDNRLLLGANHATRMTVENNGDVTIEDGNLVIGTAGHGIDFSAQTATSASGATTTSELLDHYEEGTWRPTLKSGSTAATLEHQDTVQGVYTKIGRLVTLQMEVDINNLNGATGIISIEGLPFTVSNNIIPTGIEASGSVSYFAGWSNNVINVGIYASSDTKLYLQKLTAAAVNPTDVNGNDIGTGEFRATITYFSG